MRINQQKSAALKELEDIENFLKEKSLREINESAKKIAGQILSNVEKLKNTDEAFLIPRFHAVFKNMSNILEKSTMSETEEDKRIYFLSFADTRLVKSLERIRGQAEEMDVFNEIYCWTQNDIDRDFWEKYKHRMPFDGFDYKSSGFFIWKPQIITQVLEKMRDGDILLYCDAGNHLHKYGRKRLFDYFNALKKNETGVLCFIQEDFLEKEYTKGDIFDYFGCRDNSKIYNTGQMAGNTILFRKCEKCEDFVKKWRRIFFDNFELHDADTFNSANFDGFIANRGEQSTLSILAKLNGAAILNFAELYTFPITVARDKAYNIHI